MSNYYPDELVNEIIAANDIVDVISSYVPLKRSGGSLKGLCPFHSERSPSFMVSPDKQLYHCFGCGEGGTVVSFVMKLESLDFVEAIRYLAERARITLAEGDSNSAEALQYEKKQTLYKLCAEAARFFNKSLMSDVGKAAQSYLIGRGIDQKTITMFGIGYAPDSFDACLSHLKQAGYYEQDILEAGLVRKSEKNERLFDFFRGRVMFPILDVRGNVIAFGGRIMGEGQPKYLNSPDSIIFNKSKTLFALNLAKRHCDNQMILAEGYMDVIAMHAAGVQNAVATLGTALTGEHARIIKRYSHEAVIAYDSDPAGQKATLAAISQFNAIDYRAKVLTLEGAKDPDEYIKQKGAQRFKELLASAKGTATYRVDMLKLRYNMDNTDEKIEFVNKVAEILAGITNNIEREVYIREIANANGVSEEALTAEIRRIMYKNNRNRNTTINSETPRTNAAGYVASKTHKMRIQPERVEGMLINLLCSDTAVYNRLKELIDPDYFTDPACKKMAEVIFNLRNKGINPEAVRIINDLGSEYQVQAASVLSMETIYDNNALAAEELINTINKQRQTADIIETSKTGDIDKLSQLIKTLGNKRKEGN